MKLRSAVGSSPVIMAGAGVIIINERNEILLGKNAVLKDTHFTEGATAKERNSQIGGHNA